MPIAEESMLKPHNAGRRAERGQALAEMGIVVVLLTFLVLGIVEVGYAFLRTNIIVHAARDGARYGATLDSSLRNSDGCFTDTSTIQTHVENTLSSVGFTPSSIGIVQGCDGTVPTITVTIQGPLDLIFNFIGTSFPVDRSVTFQDEGRSCTGGGASC
jgi:Flp pilus assembly protein TadG